VSVIPSAVESRPVADRTQPRRRTWAGWLILLCYLAGAMLVTWRLWADPAGRAQIGDTADVDLFAWFMRYDAAAIGHGHLPALFTVAMNAPRGINLMWNTSFLLPGVVLAPVTLLAGAQTSLTIMLVLGMAGSAASLFWVLRRWGASLTAAGLGGAVYGFSPAIINSGVGHYHLQFAVLPPLIIDAVLRIVTGRGHAVRTGVWLGLLVAAQLFTGEELLADSGITALVLIVVLVAACPRDVRVKARNALLGLATGLLVVLVIGGHALWVQFHGPLTQHNHPVGPDPFTNRASFFVNPSSALLFHTSTSAASAAHFGRGLAEYLAYLGWPLLAVLVAASIRYFRDPKVRAAAITWVVLEVLSFGGGNMRSGSWFSIPGWVLPFHWLQGSPVLSQVLPDRLSILADGAAAAVLAFTLDRARSSPRPAWTWRCGAIPIAIAVVAVLPLIPVPYQVAPTTPVPAGWQTAFTRLKLAPDARVLVVPVGSGRRPEVLRWEADTGEPATMIGGYFVGPNREGQQMVYIPGPATTAAEYLDALWNGWPNQRQLPDGLIQSDLAYWRPSAVVAVTSPGSELGRYLTGVLGPPRFRAGQVLVWRLPADITRYLLLRAAASRQGRARDVSGKGRSWPGQRGATAR
jgi:hypothetical protein